MRSIQQRQCVATAALILFAALLACTVDGGQVVHGHLGHAPMRKARHALQQHHRRLQQATDSFQVTWKVSQCRWPSGGWPPRCEPTHALLLRENTSLPDDIYGIRATAFLTAGTALCAQFGKGDCGWPCSWNGEECALDGKLVYGAWECPRSEARQHSTCNWKPHAESGPWCRSLVNCTYTPPPRSPPPSPAPPPDNTTTATTSTAAANSQKAIGSCDATFFLKLSDSDKMQWRNDWARMLAEVWGCCRGSNNRNKRIHHCDEPEDVPYADVPTWCATERKTDCYWDEDQSLCLVRPDYEVKMLYEGQGQKNPVRWLLSNMARECDRVTDAGQCNNYKPVTVSEQQIKRLLSFDLDKINHPVADANCTLRRRPAPQPRWPELPGTPDSPPDVVSS